MRCVSLWLLLLLASSALPARGASYTWSLVGDGNWESGANWGQPNPLVYPKLIDDSATFADAIADRTITVTSVGILVGHLIFNDSNNSYTVSGTGSLALTVSSGSAELTVVDGSHSINVGLTFASSTAITIGASDSLTLGDALTGSAALTMTGGNSSSTLTLSVNNSQTLSSAITVSSGKLAATTSGALGSGSVGLSGGTLSISGADQTYNQTFTVSGGSTIDVANGKTFTLGNAANDLTGAGLVTKTGAGTLSLGFANNHSGGFVISEGTLLSTAANAIGTGNLTLSGGTLRFATPVADSTDESYNQSITVNSASTIRVDDPNLMLFIGDAPNDLTGSGALTKTGTGWIAFLTANDSFSGSWLVSEGALGSAAQGSIGTGNVTLAGGTFAIGFSNQTYGQTFTVTSDSKFDVMNGFSLTIGDSANDLTGAGSLTKEGPGDLILGQSNNHSGGWTLNEGSLESQAQGAIGTGDVTINSATLVFDAANQTYGQTFTIGGASARIEVAGSYSMTLGNAANDLVGSATVTKAGTGTLKVPYSNTFSGGWNLANGTLSSEASGALGTAIITLTGGTLSISGVDQTYNQTVTVTGSGTINVASGRTLTLGDAPNDFTGTGQLTKTGTGTLILNQSSSHSGGISLEGGTLALGHNSAAGTGEINIHSGTIKASGAARTLANAVRVSGDFTVGGSETLTLGTVTLAGSQTINTEANTTISVLAETAEGGAKSLTKHGTGTLVLTGTSSMTGSIKIVAGDVAVTGNVGSSSGMIVDGGTLSGTGVVPAVTINSGGTISPGSSPGTLHTGSETWNGGGNYTWEINQADGTAGANPGWDLTDITGSLTINATSENKFTIGVQTLSGSSAGEMANFNNAQNYTWTIATASDGIANFSAAKFTLDASAFENSLGGGSLSLVQSGNNLQIQFTAVPEPHHVAFATGLALLAFGGWRSCRRAKG